MLKDCIFVLGWLDKVDLHVAGNRRGLMLALFRTRFRDRIRGIRGDPTLKLPSRPRIDLFQHWLE
jgi:hypothetical protein